MNRRLEPKVASQGQSRLPRAGAFGRFALPASAPEWRCGFHCRASPNSDNKTPYHPNNDTG